MIGQSGSYSGSAQERSAKSRVDAQRRITQRAESDEALMAAYLDGESGAFAELFERYAPVLTRMLWRSLHDEVRDFVQQTFLHVHRARNTFTAGALFRPWLVSIAMNLKREHFRRMQRRLALEPELFGFGVRPPSEPDLIYEADRAWQALEALPGRERQVLELSCGGGLSANDIATEMNTTISGVKSLAHRARQRLRSNQRSQGSESDFSTTGLVGSSR